MRKIPKLEGMKYSLGERNEVATFSLADESAYAWKVDNISSNAQVAGESNTAHLIPGSYAWAWLDEGQVEKVRRSECKEGTFRASAELGISSSFQVELFQTMKFVIH